MFDLEKRLLNDLVDTIYQDLEWHDLGTILPINGQDPDRKLRWLLLAAASGLLMASKLAPEAWFEVSVRPGNEETAGEAEVSFKIPSRDIVLNSLDSEFRVPVRILFREPDLGETFHILVGQNEYHMEVYFLNFLYVPYHVIDNVATWVAGKYMDMYTDRRIWEIDNGQ